MSNPLQTYLDDLADGFLQRHHRKEQLFWETKMGLSSAHQEFQEAEVQLRRFVGDAATLQQLRQWRGGQPSREQSAVLDGWIEMFERNVIEHADAQAMERDLIGMETELERRRGEMELTYVDPATGQDVRASSVVLGTMVRNDPDASRRKTAWLGLRSIEDFVLANGFPEVVVARNRLARKLGYADYYDYKVQWAEGFDKATLFGLLDDLASRTAQASRDNLQELATREGDVTIQPWDYGYLSAGSLAAERDPFFAFEDALERWGRSFNALGIRYRGARVTLDLIDRPGKYENGFMHGPTPAFVRQGEWLPAEINFTANAVPDQVGSGYSALATLFHEGGHAAHFANIVTDAPCFSQEFAPTSTAFAETQSMFCDSLVRDADWQLRYAKDSTGQTIPLELIERECRLRQPAAAHGIRRMLTVCYFEKELYELDDDEVTADRILSIARDVERRLLSFEEGSPRPTLSIPHLLSGDASCYYHGYVLAEMAVEQTRDHFFRRYGHLVDNPRIGADLAEHYWRPGNSISFLDYVHRLTGKPLSADALVTMATASPEEAVARARQLAQRAQDLPAAPEPIELDVRLTVAHGREQIVQPEMTFADAASAFRSWVQQRWPAKAVQ